MRHFLFSAIAAATLCATQAYADAFATCNVWQVTTKTIREKVPATAAASCDTGGGGVKGCNVSVGATQPGYTLDNNDTKNACYRLDGDNPCAFVQYGPVIFNSETQASQSFTTNSDRVTLQLSVGQFKKTDVVDSEKIIQPNLRLIVGETLVVKRLKAAASVRLECKKKSGGSFINEVPGPDNSGGRVKLLQVQTGVAYDLYVFTTSRQ